MRRPILEKQWPPAAISPASPTDIPGLVRQLVQQIGRDEPPAPTGGDDVILDVQVDGVRCLLVRLPSPAARPVLVLSPREREIARMVARGYPNKTIARVLEISSWTVGTYLRRIFAKLNVGSRAAMVARLMEGNLLKD
jgi:DNA-binding CsgD family transcriptional regulator